MYLILNIVCSENVLSALHQRHRRQNMSLPTGCTSRGVPALQEARGLLYGYGTFSWLKVPCSKPGDPSISIVGLLQLCLCRLALNPPLLQTFSEFLLHEACPGLSWSCCLPLSPANAIHFSKNVDGSCLKLPGLGVEGSGCTGQGFPAGGFPPAVVGLCN